MGVSFIDGHRKAEKLRAVVGIVEDFFFHYTVSLAVILFAKMVVVSLLLRDTQFHDDLFPYCLSIMLVEMQIL